MFTLKRESLLALIPELHIRDRNKLFIVAATYVQPQFSCIASFAHFAAMVKKFGAYCPWGHKCSYGNKCMQSFDSAAEARDKIVHHLVNSTRHLLEQDEAERLACEADIPEWEDKQAASSSKSGGKASSGSAGWQSSGGKGKGHRSAPYPATGGLDVQAIADAVTQRLNQNAAMAHGDGSGIADGMDPLTQQLVVPAGAQGIFQHWTRAVNSLTRGHEALRTAARMCRSAGQAFEEEAHTIQTELEFLSSLQFQSLP